MYVYIYIYIERERISVYICSALKMMYVSAMKEHHNFATLE